MSFPCCEQLKRAIEIKAVEVCENIQPLLIGMFGEQEYPIHFCPWCRRDLESLDKCSLCGKLLLAHEAHLHQSKMIGDCCWDERLRATE